MKTLEEIKGIVDLCTYPGLGWRIGGDGEPWLQVVALDGKDNITGEAMAWRGRKWKLSFYMSDTEIVQTCWAAIQRALIHEASEHFKFSGAAIYDRHISVHRLHEVVSAGASALDGRPEAVGA